MSREPDQLTPEDIDKIIAMERRLRAKREGPKGKITGEAAVAALADMPMPAAPPKSTLSWRR